MFIWAGSPGHPEGYSDWYPQPPTCTRLQRPHPMGWMPFALASAEQCYGYRKWPGRIHSGKHKPTSNVKSMRLGFSTTGGPHYYWSKLLQMDAMILTPSFLRKGSWSWSASRVEELGTAIANEEVLPDGTSESCGGIQLSVNHVPMDAQKSLCWALAQWLDDLLSSPASSSRTAKVTD